MAILRQSLILPNMIPISFQCLQRVMTSRLSASATPCKGGNGLIRFWVGFWCERAALGRVSVPAGRNQAGHQDRSGSIFSGQWRFDHYFPLCRRTAYISHIRPFVFTLPAVMPGCWAGIRVAGSEQPFLPPKLLSHAALHGLAHDLDRIENLKSAARHLAKKCLPRGIALAN